MQLGMYMTHIAIMFPLRARRFQYSHPAEWPLSGGRPATIVSSSAALTAACSEGSLRNQKCQTRTQMNPTIPKQMKMARQCRKLSSQSTSIGVSPPTR
jgi:hypothetical protein